MTFKMYGNSFATNYMNTEPNSDANQIIWRAYYCHITAVACYNTLSLFLHIHNYLCYFGGAVLRLCRVLLHQLSFA